VRLEDAVAEVCVVLPAPPERVFALLTDIERMGGLGPENVRSQWESDERGVGARFRGWNERDGRAWDVPCTIVEHQPPVRFAWVAVPESEPSATWSYELTEVDDGTEVRQRFQHGPGFTYLRRACEKHPERAAEFIAARTGELERNMRATLEAAARLL
jgi:uncharacterized protein YndB with AHSA1/START domain